MGFITTVTVNNDLLHELLHKSPERVCRLFHDGLIRMHGGQVPISVPVAGITVVETHHVDHALPILVGGGKEAQVVTGVSIHYTSQDPEGELLKRLADKHGYTLQKRRKKKEGT